MTLSRRALLVAPLLIAAEDAPPSSPVLLARADGLAALTWRGRGAVVLPGAARLVGVLPLGGVSLAALAVPADAGLTLLALAGPGEARPRLLALEVLAWRGPHGAHLETGHRVAGGLVVLRREAAVPRDGLRWRREGWTDYLAWTPPLMADAPVRTAPAGTWQAALGGLRRRVLAWLAEPRAVLTPGDIAGLGLRGTALARLIG